MRSIVLGHALLTGNEREAPCDMLAMKESHPHAAEPAYSRCNVIDAPIDLPDGDYMVHFDGLTVPARKEGGLWIPEGAAQQEPIHPRQTQPAPRMQEAASILLTLLKDEAA